MSTTTRNLIGRRHVLIGAGSAAAMPLVSIETLGQAKSDPAVAFMGRAAKDLIAAQRAQSPLMFAQALLRHGDMGGIVTIALGEYASRVSPADRAILVRGTTRWLGKYAAQQGQQYPVRTVTFADSARKARYGTVVDSTVILQDGTNYPVSWLLIGGANSTYRVRDAQVLNFWMTPFLRTRFVEYIQQNGGVPALVNVMSRH
jgi:ABC-type transporter MlaC component